MAALTPTTMQGSGQRTATVNTLTASDTFAYAMGTGQILVLWNTTAGTITPTITGDTAFNFWGKDLGVAVGVTSGYPVALNAGQMIALALDEARMWLSPGVTITTGTGLLAILLNP